MFPSAGAGIWTESCSHPPPPAPQGGSLVIARSQVPGDSGASSCPWGADGQAGTGSKATKARTWLTSYQGGAPWGRHHRKSHVSCQSPGTLRSLPQESHKLGVLVPFLAGSPSVTRGLLCSCMCPKNLMFSCPMWSQIHVSHVFLGAPRNRAKERGSGSNPDPATSVGLSFFMYKK